MGFFQLPYFILLLRVRNFRHFVFRTLNRLSEVHSKLIPAYIPGLACPLLAASVVPVSNAVKTTQIPSSVLIRYLQWQLDANLGITYQLLRDYESGVITGVKLLTEQESLLESQGANWDREVDDRLVELRSQWNELLEKMRKIELALQSAFKTLHSSVETTFLCEPIIDYTGCNPIEPSQGVNLSSQASMLLYSVEKEYQRLNERHAASIIRWSELLSQHVKKFQNES